MATNEIKVDADDLRKVLNTYGSETAPTDKDWDAWRRLRDALDAGEVSDG